MAGEYELYLALGRFGLSLIAIGLAIYAIYRSYQTSDNKAYQEVQVLKADIKGIALVIDQVENFAKATNNRLAAYQSGKTKIALGAAVASQANDRDSLDKRIARGEFRHAPSDESEVA